MTEFVAFCVQFFSFPVLFWCVLSLFPISCKASCPSVHLPPLWCATPVSHCLPLTFLTAAPDSLKLVDNLSFEHFFRCSLLSETCVFLDLSFVLFKFRLVSTAACSEVLWGWVFLLFLGYLLNMSMVPPVRFGVVTYNTLPALFFSDWRPVSEWRISISFIFLWVVN